MESNKYYIGIDPGKTGSVAILDEDGRVFSLKDTPIIGKEYDKAEMIAILNKYENCHAVLEDVHATQMGGKVSNFDFGRGKGLWEMALMSLKIPHTMVKPKAWQKEMWQGVNIQYKPTARRNKKGEPVKKVDTKATSLLAAKNLFPNQEFRNISDKTGKPLSSINDGLVDAILMAEYCRRKFK